MARLGLPASLGRARVPLPQVNWQQPTVDEVASTLRQPYPLHLASGCGATVECIVFTDLEETAACAAGTQV